MQAWKLTVAGLAVALLVAAIVTTGCSKAEAPNPSTGTGVVGSIPPAPTEPVVESAEAESEPDQPAESSSGEAESEAGEDSVVTTESGLQYVIDKPGSGAEAVPGKLVSVHYTGTLKATGEKFDSSLDRGEPIEFVLGSGQVIPGWDEGIAGMKVGEKRTLIIPSELGYGPVGSPPVIPPNADLVFETELVAVK